MFRFGTKTLLFVFVLVALWCSTFSGYAAGSDVRASVQLILLVTAGFAGVYSAGPQRAFWAGVFVAMLLMGGSLLQGPANKYVPNFYWRTMQPTPAMPVQYYAPPQTVYPQPVLPPAAAVPADPAPPMQAPVFRPQPPVAVFPTVASVNSYAFALAVNDTIAMLWALVLAVVVGAIGALICSGRQSE